MGKARLLAELERWWDAIIAGIEASFGVRISDEELLGDMPHVVHVLLHEACHAALARHVGRIAETDHPAWDQAIEVVAQIMEGEVAAGLGLPLHPPEEHVREIQALGMAKELAPTHYEHLRRRWKEAYAPRKDLEGMLRYTHAFLFPAGTGRSPPQEGGDRGASVEL